MCFVLSQHYYILFSIDSQYYDKQCWKYIFILKNCCQFVTKYLENPKIFNLIT